MNEIKTRMKPFFNFIGKFDILRVFLFNLKEDIKKDERRTLI